MKREQMNVCRPTEVVFIHIVNQSLFLYVTAVSLSYRV